MNWIVKLEELRREFFEFFFNLFGIDAFTAVFILAILGIYRHRKAFTAFWNSLKGITTRTQRIRARILSTNKNRKASPSDMKNLSRSERNHSKIIMVILLMCLLIGAFGIILDW